MTRAEKYLKEHPDAMQEDGIPYEKPYEILCVQKAGFCVPCLWQEDFNNCYSCEDCWSEEAEE